jgi:hypothetical protein
MRTQNAGPDWGETPSQTPQPGQTPSTTPVYHPHAPVEMPPDKAPPMPENLPIGDPKPGKSDLATRWPRPGLYIC